jgi:hypothetical protein
LTTAVRTPIGPMGAMARILSNVCEMKEPHEVVGDYEHAG